MKKVYVLVFILTALFSTIFVLMVTTKVSKESFDMIFSPEIEEEVGNFKISGWIPWWEYDLGQTEANNNDFFTSLSPFNYVLEEGGQITLKKDVYADNFTYNIDIIPSISNNFDGEIVSSVINSKNEQENHVAEIVKIVTDNNYAGIDIDYEEIKPEDKIAYTNFVKQLSEALHEKDKVLSITLHTKTSDEGDWSGNQAQDWKALSDYADELRIMAYDNHWSSSTPGPIAPMPWIMETTKYAKEVIPKKKRILGIGIYGYDWVVGTNEAQTLTLKEIYNLISETEGSEEYSHAYEAPYFKYEKEGKEHVVWYEDEESVGKKIELAQKEYGGICIWSMGGIPTPIYRIISYSLDKK